MLTIAATTQPATQPTTRPAPGPWYAADFLDYALWRWGALLGVLLLAFVIGKVVSYNLSRQGRRLIDANRFVAIGVMLRSLAGPAAMVIFAAGLYLGGMVMDLKVHRDVNVPWFWDAVCKTLAALAAGWAVYRLVDLLEMVLTRWTARTRTQLDDQLVPIVRKTLRVFIVIVAALFIAQNIFDWNIGALLAGLGLGGLAFALAAQDALKNFFGSVAIFADRPFQLGERVKVGNHDGNVEEVGFRSTRIRTLTGHLVTIPNSAVADTAVENIGRRPYIRRVLDVNITYGTPPEKVRRAVEIIEEMLEARADHFAPDFPGRVYFNEFNAASLNIVVYYWFTPPDWWEYLAFTHDFNMELLRRFNEEGIEFAFPTQTLYLKQDSDLSAEVRLDSGTSGQG